MANKGIKPNKSPSAIGNYLLSPECSKLYNDNRLTILTKGRNIYHLIVLESLFIKAIMPKMYKLIYVFFLIFFYFKNCFLIASVYFSINVLKF